MDNKNYKFRLAFENGTFAASICGSGSAIMAGLCAAFIKQEFIFKLFLTGQLNQTFTDLET